MRTELYVNDRFGSLTTNPIGAWPHPFFLPTPIPRTLVLSPESMAAVSRADIALGRLSGLAMLIDDPELLLGPAMAQEALSSSRIEGTQASLSDVLSAESSDEPIADENLREVNTYLDAAAQGRELLREWPLTQRFFCALHETLLTGVRGEEKFPGELRRSPVWIGSPNARPETARFIPPHHDRLGELLADWERFVNEPSTMPSVLRAAMMHYQFETIHPFLDGNGRIGRLLIGFLLVSDGVLSAPILPISGYFERNRDEYYDRLQAVRERAEIEEWVQFFSEGVEQQANQSAARIRALVEIRERYRRETINDRSALTSVVDLVFRNPVVTVAAVVRHAGVSRPAASAALRRAESRGWLRSAGRWGRGGRERWVATEIWAAVTTEDAFDDEPREGRS
ncbi:Fic/DOC family N-terminal domain-containing protein [Microbacterium sp. SSW1-59]|uniref:Fic family protein n=1 Tax=Microbacterium xanthum TaxID=3079794 RepID=UPI002AD2D867|nr:Fic/DOC family N-terminal domain-containing protein [Microbacterium sp. SSW1-59]MDZ8200760.1 Fic/DOC family N-terminal domain-containing protein [Microbacterium sp. SSW1-59]